LCYNKNTAPNQTTSVESYMFNPTSIVIEAFLDELLSCYIDLFGNDERDIHLLLSNARNALEIIANGNAPYHDVNHTMLVTMVGTEILHGKIMMEGETEIDRNAWVHFVISLLHHDIGYMRGICKADRSGRYAINDRMDTVTPPPGATDAYLTPYHVDRGKLFIRERFAGDSHIDTEVICENIERTRFPIPSAEDHQSSNDLPGLLRAADLIGQLADPQYFRKISALFAEFDETGQAQKMGYTTAADLQSDYPKFYWGTVSPFISDAIRYLRRTQAGQEWVANLYANVFTEEHEAPSFGPERRINKERRDDKKGSERVIKAKEPTAKNQRKRQRRVSDVDDKSKTGNPNLAFED